MNSQVSQLSENGSDDPIFVLPPYKVERVMVAASEIKDWGLEMFGIPNLWRQTKGEGIRVAVLDTGIALKHRELVDAIEDARDFTNSPSGPSDVDGHGTHVAGIIAARQNGGGVVGVAPEAKLLVGKVLGDNGYGTAQQLVSGIRWAIDKKVDIISMSLGSPVASNEMHRAIQAAIEAGIFVICAAGNSGPNLDTVDYPAIYPETIAVGAIDRSRRIAQFSSRGKAVDIVAPGDNILSTYPPKGFAVLSGTSMATPFVSGVVALMLAKHRRFGGQTPVKTQADLIEHLRKTAIDGGMPGFDPHYGFGLIDPEALLLSGFDETLKTIVKEEFTSKYILKLKQLTEDSTNSFWNH